MKLLSILFFLFVFCVQVPRGASAPPFGSTSVGPSPFYFTEWSKWFTDGDIEYRYELGVVKTPMVEWINHSKKTISKFTMTTTVDDGDEESGYVYVKQEVVQSTAPEEHEKAAVHYGFHCSVEKVHFSDFVYEK